MAITLIENFRAVFYAPFYAAAALGAYEKEGVAVEIRMAPAVGEALQALAGGGGQVFWGGPLRVMNALDRDPASGFCAFCEVVGRDPFFLVGRTPNPGFTIAQLPRWTLAAVTEVPTPWICLRHDLRLAGTDPAAVRLAPERTMAQNAAALRAGELELIQVFEPFASDLVREGTGHVWHAAADRGATSYTTLNTTRRFLAGHPETALRMTRAMYRTLKWLSSHDTHELAQLIGSWFAGMPVEQLAACCERYRSRGLWNTTPVPARAGLEWLRDAMLGAGAIRTRFAYEDCVDARFAEQAVREDPPSI